MFVFAFDGQRVEVWGIENNTGSPALSRIMRTAGYDLAEFCESNQIWRRGDVSA